MAQASCNVLSASILSTFHSFKLAFGDLARPSRSLLNIQKLNVTNNIKIRARHEFLKKKCMLQSLALGGNESNLAPQAAMSNSAAVPRVLVSILYN